MVEKRRKEIEIIFFFQICKQCVNNTVNNTREKEKKRRKKRKGGGEKTLRSMCLNT
jgi:hypothetical protein